MKRAPVHGSVKLDGNRLTITVFRKDKALVTAYTIGDLRPDPAVAMPAYALTKDDGTEYHVAMMATGAECSCPDFELFREKRDPRGCKHVVACRCVGLIPNIESEVA